MDKIIIEKLKDIEAQFLESYPQGFEDEEIIKIVKKFKSEKFSQEVNEFFKKENFSQPELICESYSKLISKSPLISLFEKPKLRDAIKFMGMYEKDMFSIALYELLYGNQKEGLNDMVEILAKYQLAKWSLITLIPYYLNRKKEYFVKPTTTKNILKYFEIENIVYKPRPTYEFYKAYKDFLDELKKHSHQSLNKENAQFTGFMMMCLKA